MEQPTVLGEKVETVREHDACDRIAEDHGGEVKTNVNVNNDVGGNFDVLDADARTAEEVTGGDISGEAEGNAIQQCSRSPPDGGAPDATDITNPEVAEPMTVAFRESLKDAEAEFKKTANNPQDTDSCGEHADTPGAVIRNGRVGEAEGKAGNSIGPFKADKTTDTSSNRRRQCSRRTCD
jgi:hypothetical protein